MKGKKFYIIASVIGFIVLLTLFLFVKNLISPKSDTSEENSTPTEAFPTIDSSVKVNIEFTNNNKSMVLTIKDIPDGIETIDYEISYQTGAGIPKGNIGQIKIDGKKEVTRSGDELTLGTCSRGKCVYYEGVKKVSLSLKFHKTDSSVSIFQKDYSL